jgi:hypothetical protein
LFMVFFHDEVISLIAGVPLNFFLSGSLYSFFGNKKNLDLVLHQPDLLHQGYLVVEEFLLDDLPVLPVRYRAELDLELFPCRGNDLSVRTGHRALEGSGEIGDRAGTVTLTEKNFVRPVSDLIVGESFEECDSLFLVGRTAVGR